MNTRVSPFSSMRSIAFFIALMIASAPGQEDRTVRMGSVMLPSEYLDYTVRLTKSDGGSLVFIDNNGDIVIAEVTGKQFSASFWSQEPFIRAAKWVVGHQSPLLMEGGSTEIPMGLLPISDNLSSFMAYPLKQGSNTVGVISLVRLFGREAFVNSDYDLVGELANQASDLIKKVREQTIRENIDKTASVSKSWIYLAPDFAIIREAAAAIELGMNIYPTKLSPYYSDSVSNTGTVIGLLIPIRVPAMSLWYHVKATIHGARGEGGLRDSYVTGLNELLFGKALRLKRAPIELTPLFGLGFNNGIIVHSIAQAGFVGGWTHYYWSYDLGLLVRHQTKISKIQYSQGVLLNYERAFVYKDAAFKGNNTRMRINLSLVVGY